LFVHWFCFCEQFVTIEDMNKSVSLTENEWKVLIDLIEEYEDILHRKNCVDFSLETTLENKQLVSKYKEWEMRFESDGYIERELDFIRKTDKPIWTNKHIVGFLKNLIKEQLRKEGDDL
jgi:hypothetical protein